LGEPPQRFAATASAHKKEVPGAIEVTGPDPNNRLHDHVAQQVQPEPSSMFSRQWSHALVAVECTLEKRSVVKTGQQRKIVHRVPTYGIIKVDKGSDFGRSSKDIPKREVFMDKAPVFDAKQRGVLANDGVDGTPFGKR
jgi:hypothetical protein